MPPLIRLVTEKEAKEIVTEAKAEDNADDEGKKIAGEFFEAVKNNDYNRASAAIKDVNQVEFIQRHGKEISVTDPSSTIPSSDIIGITLKPDSLFEFSDDNMNFSLANFRPEEYAKFRVHVARNFHKALKTKKEKRVIYQLKKAISNENEDQKSWLNILDNLYKYYPLYAEKLSSVPNTTKLRNRLRKMKEFYERKQKMNN